MLPILVIAAGSIAKSSGLKWAQSKAVMGGFCVVASVLIALDVPYLWQIELHPACVADTLRYTTTVTELQFCSPDAVAVEGVGGPLVAILGNIIVLLLGIAFWIQRRWPWMALGSFGMFLAAGLPPALVPAYSLPIANFGEILFTLGLISSGVHFARQSDSPATARVATEAVGEASG